MPNSGCCVIRWILLLAVMELAALAMYVPSRGDLTVESALYPEKLLRLEWTGEEQVLHTLDRHRDQRCATGMVSYGVMIGCWLIALAWLAKSNGELDRRKLIVILAGAAVVCVTLWGLPPTFSDDSYRYRFEGAQTVGGYNPYQVRPDEAARMFDKFPELSYSTDFRWRPTIYGPTTEFLFGANAIFGNTMLGLRAILLAAEGLLLYICAGLLRRRGQPIGWLVAVALCPLLIIETHLDGHIEMLPIALTLAALLALERKSWVSATLLFALAFNVKYLWPALAAFLLLGRLARQKKLLASAGVFLLATAVLWLPFLLMSWADVKPKPGDWATWLPLPVQRVIEAPLQFLERYNFNATIYRYVADQFHPSSGWPKLFALALLVAAVGSLIWRRRWRLGLEDIVLVLAAALLISPTSYPWYFTWLAPGLIVLGRGELWKKIGPPVWIVLFLAMTPALQEFLAGLFRGDRTEAKPFPALPWMIVVAVTPLLVAAFARRLMRPRFGLAVDPEGDRD
jgi:hypothetical protein